MENANYNCKFTVPQTPGEVFDHICNVNGWWGNTQGSTIKLDDEFTYKVGTTWVNFRITEMIPGKKIAWLATDCDLPWLEDKKEWKGTTVTFDLQAVQGGSQLEMTHIGLTPKLSCFNDCKKGWDFYVGNSLQSLIITGVGKPDTPGAER